MSEQDNEDRPHVLLIDGGTVYERVVKRLETIFALRHVTCPTEGLNYANNSFNIHAVIVDLMCGSKSTSKPSLLGLWIVDQLREFSTCSAIPIVIISHWPSSVIEKAARQTGFSLEERGYVYAPMNQIDAVIQYLNSPEAKK